jgi:hypothetical protein
MEGGGFYVIASPTMCEVLKQSDGCSMLLGIEVIEVWKSESEGL